MTHNHFLDRSRPPSERQIDMALGAKRAWLEELRRHSDPPLAVDWKFYGSTIGWTMKLLAAGRNMCFVVVGQGSFAVSFILGDAAVDAARSSRLPDSTIARIVGARRYVEGRGVRLEITSRRALEQAKTILEIKASATPRSRRRRRS